MEALPEGGVHQTLPLRHGSGHRVRRPTDFYRLRYPRTEAIRHHVNGRQTL